jgi:hypothetical protein
MQGPNATTLKKEQSDVIGIKTEDTVIATVNRVDRAKGLIFMDLNQTARFMEAMKKSSKDKKKGVLHKSKLEGTECKVEDFKVGQKYHVTVEDVAGQKSLQCRLSL